MALGRRRRERQEDLFVAPGDIRSAGNPFYAVTPVRCLVGVALMLAACSPPDAIILKEGALEPGVWYEVGRVTGYGDRNLSVCLDEYAPALSERAASLSTNPVEFSCASE